MKTVRKDFKNYSEAMAEYIIEKNKNMRRLKLKEDKQHIIAIKNNNEEEKVYKNKKVETSATYLYITKVVKPEEILW